MASEQEAAKISLPETTATPPVVISSHQESLSTSNPITDKNEKSKPKGGARIKGAAKKRKTKMPKDVTAPRQPLTGYVRYLNERRDSLRAADPSLSFADVTKRLASEWGRLPAEEKQQYLDAAEQDRERYMKEWSIYKESDAYKAFKQQQQERKEAEGNKGGGGVAGSGLTSPPIKRNKSNTGGAVMNKANRDLSETMNAEASPNLSATLNNGNQSQASTGAQQALSNIPSNNVVPNRPKAAVTPTSMGISSSFSNTGNSASNDINQRDTDIPIFTEQFLQHNKLRETELRQLRKANTDYEQQNAILQKHIESMRGAVERTKDDIVTQKARTTLLRGHLTALQEKLVRGLANTSLPGGLRGATKQNIEQYMETLRNLAVENKSNAAVKQAREFLSKMEMSV